MTTPRIFPLGGSMISCNAHGKINVTQGSKLSIVNATTTFTLSQSAFLIFLWIYIRELYAVLTAGGGF